MAHAKISLHWGALHKQQARLITNQIDYSTLLANQFPQEYKLWQEKLRFKHYDATEYYPLIMHPWQWRNQIQNSFSSLIDNKELILLPHHQSVKPSMSFRTMMPLKNNSCHIELAAAVHTNPTVPTLLPAAINDHFSLSVWLNKLLHQHQYYQQSLFLAEPLAGLSIQPSHVSTTPEKQFALILRKNPSSFLRPQQKMVPLATLFAKSPLSNLPLLIEIINSSGLNPMDYFRLYCRQVLVGQLHLLLYYGVALESHQQNTLVVFTNNKPEALVMREQTKAQVCMNACYDYLVKPDFHRNSTITTDNLAVICQQFMASNLQNNLAHWLRHLNVYYSLATENLWQVVYNELQIALKRLSHEIVPTIFRQQVHHLLVQPWQHPCSLSMRLNSQGGQLVQLIANPLRDFYT